MQDLEVKLRKLPAPICWYRSGRYPTMTWRY